VVDELLGLCVMIVLGVLLPFIKPPTWDRRPRLVVVVVVVAVVVVFLPPKPKDPLILSNNPAFFVVVLVVVEGFLVVVVVVRLVTEPPFANVVLAQSFSCLQLTPSTQGFP